MRAPPQSFYRYLPTDSLDREWGIYATSAGFVEIVPGMPYPPPGHPKGYAFLWETGRELDEMQVHLIPRGSGFLETGAKSRNRHAIEWGSVFVLFPGVWHRYAPVEGTGWLDYWIGFKGEILKHMVSKRFFSPEKPVINLNNPTPIVNLFTEMVACLSAPPAGVSRIIGAMALHIMAKVHASAAIPAPRVNRAEIVVRESKLMLGQHLEQHFDLELLAKKLGVGYHWLRRTFKQQTGLSLHQYRLQTRVNRSKQLLIETDFTVAQIAAATGFERPYYFSQLFKSKVGCAPRVFRAEATRASEKKPFIHSPGLNL